LPIRRHATSFAREAGMTLENILMLAVSLLLMAYLIYALLKPEKF